MTTERINHRAHGHDNTKAARAKCRRDMAAFRKVIAADVVAARDNYIADHIRTQVANNAVKARMDRNTTGCTINATHCENCGSTDYESINCGDQGYTACCNELVSWSSTDCRNHHGWS